MTDDGPLELIEKLRREIKENVRLEDTSPEDLDKLQQMLRAVQKFVDERMRKPN